MESSKKCSIYEGIAAISSIDYQFQARFHRTEFKPKGDFFPLAFHLFVIGFILWRKKVKIADFFLMEFNLRRKLSLSGGFNRQNSNLLPSFISRHTQELDLIYSRHQCSKGYKSSFESVSRAVSC